MGINSVLLHYIPQPNPHIWDEASKQEKISLYCGILDYGYSISTS